MKRQMVLFVEIVTSLINIVDFKNTTSKSKHSLVTSIMQPILQHCSKKRTHKPLNLINLTN